MFRSTVYFDTHFATIPVAIDDILVKIFVMNPRNHVIRTHAVKIALERL